MHNLLLGLLCVLTMMFDSGTSQHFDCQEGSVNISLSEDGIEFADIDCTILLDVDHSTFIGLDDSCEAVQSLKIFSRKEWQGSEDRNPPDVSSSPADYVVFSIASDYIHGRTFTEKIQNLQKEHNINYKSLLYNFIITEDGEIYEALGWDKQNYILSGGLNSVRISFMMEINAVQSKEAIQAFKFLMRAGTCRGSISHNYKIIPYTHIRDYIQQAPYRAEHELLRHFEKLEDDKEFQNMCGISPPTPITFREEWDVRLNVGKLLKYDSAIEMVIVRDFDARCLNLKNCHAMMEYYRDRGKLAGINFFIADDGQVYEYLGWEYTETEWFKYRKAIIVAFLGTYSNYIPSNRTLSVFNRFLRYGRTSGYLSKYYIIASYLHVQNSNDYIGNSLHNELKNWDKFSDI